MKVRITIFAVVTLGFADLFAEAATPNIVLFLVDDMGLMDTSVPMLNDEPRRGGAQSCRKPGAIFYKLMTTGN